MIIKNGRRTFAENEMIQRFKDGTSKVCDVCTKPMDVFGPFKFNLVIKDNMMHELRNHLPRNESLCVHAYKKLLAGQIPMSELRLVCQTCIRAGDL